MANREAIERTRAAIFAADDSHFDMTDWGIDEPTCGSPACLAGFACYANGVSNSGFGTRSKAEKALGFDEGDCVGIFTYPWSCDSGGSPFDGEITDAEWYSISRADAMAMCDLLLEYCDGKRALSKCTWVEAFKYEKRRTLPASITDALTAREGPLRGEEPSDAAYVAAMEAQS